MYPTPSAAPSLQPTRLGFHYYPDTLHYRESDLQTWLPELRGLGASWLVLQAPAERAIPEPFLKGLLEAGIEPVLHFALPPERPGLADSLGVLFRSYAQWGVRYAILFDRPNLRATWSPAAWAQDDLVERFLDIFLPPAELALQAGLRPVFPPLEPGGDYWDTAFLRAALRGIHRRGHAPLLACLALSAYAGTAGRPLSWGAGGPERWPAARPYFTPPAAQDQIGFHIFDWYLTLSRAELGRALPLLLLKAGSPVPPPAGPTGADPVGAEPVEAGPSAAETSPTLPASTCAAQDCLEIARLLLARPEPAFRSKRRPADGETDKIAHIAAPDEALPAEVLAGCFWLLAASPDSPQAGEAWFKPEGGRGLAASALHRLWAQRSAATRLVAAGPSAAATGPTPSAAATGPSAQAGPIAAASPAGAASVGAGPSAAETLPTGQAGPVAKTAPTAEDAPSAQTAHPISHYLLLPAPEWGGEDWRLNTVRLFIEQHHPTLGYSLDEAALAARVTVVGGVLAFSDQDLAALAQAGCQVERLVENGTLIATPESYDLRSTIEQAVS